MSAEVPSSETAAKNITSQQQNLSSPYKQTYMRVKYLIYVELTQKSIQLESHVKRLQTLRKELNYISNTDWQYDPIEKYTGQS